MNETLNREGVAELLKCNSDKISELIHSEKLPGIRIGKEYVFIKEDVIQWLREKIELTMNQTGPSARKRRHHCFPSLEELPKV